MDESLVNVLKTQYGFTDEDVAALLNAGVLHGGLKRSERDIGFHEGLIGTEIPTGRGFGRVYTAANPLEHLNAGIRQAAGFYGRFKENEKQQKIQDELAELRKLFLRGGGQPPMGTIV